MFRSAEQTHMGLRTAWKFFQLGRHLGINRAVRLLDILELGFGHAASARTGAPVDAAGAPLPWYTYPAIEYLRQLDFSGATAFEYGAGNSSEFWAARVKAIVSVEDNPSWHERVQRQLRPNQRVLLRTDKKAYIDALLESGGPHDVIVLDGSYRLSCARLAVDWIRPGGLIILDNSDKFPRTARFLRDEDLIQADFQGFGPVNDYTWATSVFFTRDFRFRSTREVQPTPGIGSLSQLAREE